VKFPKKSEKNAREVYTTLQHSSWQRPPKTGRSIIYRNVYIYVLRSHTHTHTCTHARTDTVLIYTVCVRKGQRWRRVTKCPTRFCALLRLIKCVYINRRRRRRRRLMGIETRLSSSAFVYGLIFVVGFLYAYSTRSVSIGKKFSPSRRSGLVGRFSRVIYIIRVVYYRPHYVWTTRWHFRKHVYASSAERFQRCTPPHVRE